MNKGAPDKPSYKVRAVSQKDWRKKTFLAKFQAAAVEHVVLAGH